MLQLIEHKLTRKVNFFLNFGVGDFSVSREGIKKFLDDTLVFVRSECEHEMAGKGSYSAILLDSFHVDHLQVYSPNCKERIAFCVLISLFHKTWILLFHKFSELNFVQFVFLAVTDQMK